MDANYSIVLWTGGILTFVGLSSLTIMAVVFHSLKRKQDFGVEVDLGRAANLCVYIGLTILGIAALGATVETVVKGMRR